MRILFNPLQGILKYGPYGDRLQVGYYVEFQKESRVLVFLPLHFDDCDYLTRKFKWHEWKPTPCDFHVFEEFSNGIPVLFAKVLPQSMDQPKPKEEPKPAEHTDEELHELIKQGLELAKKICDIYLQKINQTKK